MEMMKHGAMMTVLSSLLVALAWPATFLYLIDIIDSKWTVALNRFSFLLDCLLLFLQPEYFIIYVKDGNVFEFWKIYFVTMLAFGENTEQ